MGKLNHFANLGMVVMKIAQELLNNQNLCKYLYYTSNNPIAEDDISDTKGLLFGTNINIKPVIPQAETNGCYVNILADMLMTDQDNPDYFVVSLRFDVLCPTELWELEESQLRPFAIMEEIDTYMRHSQKTAVGDLESKAASLIAPTDTLAGYSIFYTGTEFK